MSNLKSKFFLGVMIVAVMFVGVVFVNANTSAAATCSITSTLKLGSKGTQVACLQSTFLSLTADGNYGPKTVIAVKAWQATKGLTADGVFGPKSLEAWEGSTVTATLPVGCSSTTGFSATTGLPCNSATTSTFPAGCTSAVGYSPTTGASCATGVAVMTYPAGCTSAVGYSSTTGVSCATGTTTTPVVNNTAAGSISSDGIIGGFNNTIVGVGDVNHQVAGFQLTGAGGGSNLNLNYASIQLTETGSASGRLADYFSAVSIWENGVQVGSAPMSAFSSNNSSSLNNVYSASIPLTGATVTAGQTSNFYVAVTANSSIDSVNFGTLTNNWQVAVNNIRFTDGTGLTLTYSPTVSPNGIGSLGTGVAPYNNIQFTFGSAASANNIILNVSRASSDQNAHTVTVNATGSTTQKVPLLAMTLSDQGGQTVSINKLPVILESSVNVASGVGSVSSVTPEVYLMNGTTVLDSENVSGSSIVGTGSGVGGNGVPVGTYFYPVYFKNFNTPLLVSGTQQTLTLAADINAIGSNYLAGTSLTASSVVGNVNVATGWDLSVGNSNGTEIAITSTIVPGIANGQTVAFYSTGASVNETADTCSPSNSGGASDTSSMTCSISFSVTANGTSVYMPTNAIVNSLSAITAGTQFMVVNSSGTPVGAYTTGTLRVAASVSQVGSNATLGTGEWAIAPGTTANFQATVTLTDMGNVNNGLYRAYLNNVAYNTTAGVGAWNTNFGYNLGAINTVVPSAVQVY